MKIYIVRHGQTLWNIEKKIQSWGDSPLTEEGIKCSKEVGVKLNSIEFKKIYSSDVGRAIKTSELIRGDRNINIIEVPEFREINLERWRGKCFESFQGVEKEDYHTLFNFPHKYIPNNDESYEQFYNRVKKACKNIINENKEGNILIVTHFHTIRAILAYLKEIPLDKLAEEIVYIKNNEVIEIELA
ncbi:histidine phosphatase family protein [Clostridium tarantellae]|uniref:Histidine phosphatase family protein n=1 Tax=Clostridium tarantellae TaxID=39493 RepID=A0A6I1MI03_9CLOT|nr:histidine phosphatase family protein [Clostridium tarantellae]MPQ42770.1 histidine phosphatase family protein [Clostridium tarantellae]